MRKVLLDSCGRKIESVRISLTDRCNLRCLYCVPHRDLDLNRKSEILSFEEIISLIKCLVKLGVDKIKLTGGEPLLRKDVANLVRRIVEIPGVQDLSLTTNGVLFAGYAVELKKAGLKRVTISLDSLRSERFSFLTGHNRIVEVVRSIRCALDSGFIPVKINVVVLKGINDDEIGGFVRLTRNHNLVVRFVEFMPTCNALEWSKYFISGTEILEKIKEIVKGTTPKVIPDKVFGSGPARYFRISGYRGSFGLITPLSRPFCSGCNRLRITAAGDLVLCLHRPISFNLHSLLEKGSEEMVMAFIEDAVLQKPANHGLASPNFLKVPVSMCQIGG